MKRIAFIFFAMLMIAGHHASAQVSQPQIRERGIGPFNLSTKRGDIQVRLLRRDGDILWVDRMVQSGNFVETGLPRSDIIEFKSGKPQLFVMAEQAQTPEQITAAIDALRKMVAQLRPYRDLPGMPVNSALILQAKLNERRESWREALLIYQELLSQPYEFAEKPMVRFWTGMNLWRMGQKEKALEFLVDEPIPDEDMNFFSDVLYARADSFSATGKPREAIDNYLKMIVFYPYYRTNELRALSGIIPNYIAIADWDATVKSMEAMKTDYPDAPQTAEAEAMLLKYQAQVDKEKQFQISEE